MKRRLGHFLHRSWKNYCSWLIFFLGIRLNIYYDNETSLFVVANNNMTSGNSSQQNEIDNKNNFTEEQKYPSTNSDEIEDGFFDPFSPDPSCTTGDNEDECWSPPATTIENETIVIDATAMYGGDDPSDCFDEDDESEREEGKKICKQGSTTTKVVDKHWGSDENTLKMRDQLRNFGKGSSGSQSFDQKRPPIFLMPGLASTR